MGKKSIIADSETESTSSSLENFKKTKKSSILKPYTKVPLRKKKCKIHNKSNKFEHEEAEFKDYHCRSISRTSCPRKIRGILKNSSGYQSDKEREWEREREKERDRITSFYSSEDEDDYVPEKQARCLVGRVPRPAGSKPGRGGGVALIIRKAVKEPQRIQIKTSSVSISSKKKWGRKLTKKRSY